MSAIRNITTDVWGRGRPPDSQELFAKLCLDGQQAWTKLDHHIEEHRHIMKTAFFNFDRVKIATLTEEEVERLMQNAGIVRNTD